jgi:putative membrane protein
MSAVLAQMMDRDNMRYGGGQWWVWLIGAVALILLVGLLAFAAVRLMSFSPTGVASAQPRRSAEDVLAERLARGEIDEEEYRRRRDAIRE